MSSHADAQPYWEETHLGKLSVGFSWYLKIVIYEPWQFDNTLMLLLVKRQMFSVLIHKAYKNITGKFFITIICVNEVTNWSYIIIGLRLRLMQTNGIELRTKRTKVAAQ